MRAVRFVIPKTSGNSFRVQVDEFPYFYDSVHYHPEHQITLITKGDGTCFIGNHVSRFMDGDLFLVGKNVPHVFRSDNAYYRPDSRSVSSCISVYFKEETFGSQFFEIPEMAHIKRLLDMASMGIRIKGKDRDKAAEMLQMIREEDSFNRLQVLLSLLNLFAGSDQIRTLSSVRYDIPSEDPDHERINMVFSFLSTNFRNEVSLVQISSVAHMTPNSFCRYFRQRTGKTFSCFLNEIRIEYAGRLIAGSHEAFWRIAVQSGFNSISYFNRQFKRITGLTPLVYRKKYGQELQ